MQTISWKNCFGKFSSSLVRNFENNGRKIIIATEADNDDMSLTNGAEEAWVQICQHFNWNVEDVLKIEHYPKDMGIPEESHYDIVTINPTTWKRIDKEDLENMIGRYLNTEYDS